MHFQKHQQVSGANQVANQAQSNRHIFIYVRNQQKKAILLQTPQTPQNLWKIIESIEEKFLLNRKDQIIFYNGEQVYPSETNKIVTFNDRGILHLIDRRNLKKQISIQLKRLQNLTTFTHYNVHSNHTVQTFLSTIDQQQRQKLFLVYTGRQLARSKTFSEQYVEDNSEIFCLHRDKDQVQGQKRQKYLQQMVKQKQKKMKFRKIIYSSQENSNKERQNQDYQLKGKPVVEKNNDKDYSELKAENICKNTEQEDSYENFNQSSNKTKMITNLSEIQCKQVESDEEENESEMKQIKDVKQQKGVHPEEKIPNFKKKKVVSQIDVSPLYSNLHENHIFNQDINVTIVDHPSSEYQEAVVTKKDDFLMNSSLDYDNENENENESISEIAVIEVNHNSKQQSETLFNSAVMRLNNQSSLLKENSMINSDQRRQINSNGKDQSIQNQYIRQDTSEEFSFQNRAPEIIANDQFTCFEREEIAEIDQSLEHSHAQLAKKHQINSQTESQIQQNYIIQQEIYYEGRPERDERDERVERDERQENSVKIMEERQDNFNNVEFYQNYHQVLLLNEKNAEVAVQQLIEEEIIQNAVMEKDISDECETNQKNSGSQIYSHNSSRIKQKTSSEYFNSQPNQHEINQQKQKYRKTYDWTTSKEPTYSQLRITENDDNFRYTSYKYKSDDEEIVANCEQFSKIKDQVHLENLHQKEKVEQEEQKESKKSELDQQKEQFGQENEEVEQENVKYAQEKQHRVESEEYQEIQERGQRQILANNNQKDEEAMNNNWNSGFKQTQDQNMNKKMFEQNKEEYEKPEKCEEPELEQYEQKKQQNYQQEHEQQVQEQNLLSYESYDNEILLNTNQKHLPLNQIHGQDEENSHLMQEYHINSDLNCDNIEYQINVNEISSEKSQIEANFHEISYSNHEEILCQEQLVQQQHTQQLIRETIDKQLIQETIDKQLIQEEYKEAHPKDTITFYLMKEESQFHVQVSEVASQDNENEEERNKVQISNISQQQQDSLLSRSHSKVEDKIQRIQDNYSVEENEQQCLLDSSHSKSLVGKQQSNVGKQQSNVGKQQSNDFSKNQSKIKNTSKINQLEGLFSEIDEGITSKIEKQEESNLIENVSFKDSLDKDYQSVRDSLDKDYQSILERNQNQQFQEHFKKRASTTDQQEVPSREKSERLPVNIKEGKLFAGDFLFATEPFLLDPMQMLSEIASELERSIVSLH